MIDFREVRKSLSPRYHAPLSSHHCISRLKKILFDEFCKKFSLGKNIKKIKNCDKLLRCTISIFRDSRVAKWSKTKFFYPFSHFQQKISSTATINFTSFHILFDSHVSLLITIINFISVITLQKYCFNHTIENSFCHDESYEWTEPACTRKALLKLNLRCIFEHAQSAAKARRILSESFHFRQVVPVV